MTTIIKERLDQLDTLSLKHGAHSAEEAGKAMCALEAVAYIAGEKHTDHPVCVCPVIAAFGRSWNDGLRSDADRDRLLKPILPLMVGTVTTPEDRDKRAWMATDWSVRVSAVAWLRLAKLDAHADALESMPEIVDVESCDNVMVALRAARKDANAAGAAAGDAAWDAAGAAARAAAGDAARAAAGAAARDAAWDAAGAAAGDAAWDAARAAARAAARDAARDAAWDAARAAARAKLDPTVELLQESAAELLKRMCMVGREITGDNK